MKLNFKEGNFETMLATYKLFLTYTKSAVARTYGERCINSILELISTSTDLELIQQVYDATLRSLEDAKNKVFPSSQLSFLSFISLFHLFIDYILDSVVHNQPQASKVVARKRRIRPHRQGVLTLHLYSPFSSLTLARSPLP